MPRFEHVTPSPAEPAAPDPLTEPPSTFPAAPVAQRFLEVEQDGTVLRVCAGFVRVVELRWARDYADRARASAALARIEAMMLARGYEPLGPSVALAGSAPAPDAELAALEEQITHAPDDDAGYIALSAQLGGASEGPLVKLPRPDDREVDASAGERESASASAALTEEITWQHGFARSLRVAFDSDASDVPAPLAIALRTALRAPRGRFIRELTVSADRLGTTSGYEMDIYAIADARPPLLASLCIGHALRARTSAPPQTGPRDEPAIGDCEPLWTLPALRSLTLQGAEITLGDIDAPCLERLEIRTPSLGKAAVAAIVRANASELRTLRLWLGAGCDLADLAPLLQDVPFPKLTELGLMTCAFTDALVTNLLDAPMLARLEVLDLSQGTLTDAGAATLAANASKLRHLHRIDVDDNQLSESGTETLALLGPALKTGTQRRISAIG